jgi:hypothetical protein
MGTIQTSMTVMEDKKNTTNGLQKKKTHLRALTQQKGNSNEGDSMTQQVAHGGRNGGRR